MPSPEQNKLAVQNLIAKANGVTGKSDTDLTSAVDELVAGYGQGGSGGGLDINGVIREYEVNAGASVSAGDFVEFVNKVSWGNGIFNSATSSYISACKLDNSRVLITYQNSSNTLSAVVLSIEDGAVVIGAETIFSEGGCGGISAITLTDKKAIIVYSDTSNSNYGTAVLLAIDGSDITVVSRHTFTSTATSSICAISVASNNVLVIYSQYAIVLAIENEIITNGSAIKFENYSTSYHAAEVLSGGRVLVAYNYRGSSGYAIVFTVNGTAVSKGTEVSITGNPQYISLAKLTDDKVIVVSQNFNNSYVGTSQLLTIAGTSISAGTAVLFNTSGSQYISAVGLTDSSALVIFSEGTAGKAVILTVSGSTVSVGTEIGFDTSKGRSNRSIILFSPNNALLIYDTGSQGKYQSFSIEGAVATPDSAVSGEILIQKATSNLHNVGVAKTAGAEGEMVEVYCAV